MKPSCLIFHQVLSLILFVQYGVSISAQSIMVASGTGTSVGNDPLTNLLAGMSKNQLYEVMVQMKVCITMTGW